MRAVGLVLAAIVLGLALGLVGFAVGFTVGRASAAPPVIVPQTQVDIPVSRTPPPAIPLPSAEPEFGTGISSEEGTATYCAPTPRYCQNWTRPKLLGAVRSFSYGDRPYHVQVWHGNRHVTVKVVSHCACPDTLIDLSVAAFEKLAPLWRGRIDVRVEPVGDIRLPQTDVP